MSSETFDNIFLNLSKEAGRLRFAEGGFGWKLNKADADKFTLDARNFGPAQWSRVARGYEVRIVDRSNSHVVQLDGFDQTDYDRLAKLFRSWYSAALESREHSLRGWNWGRAELGKTELQFTVANRPAFEIPYTEISNTNLTGRNEVALEFAPSNDGDKNLGFARPAGSRAGAGKDQLVEMRFFVPGTTTTRKRAAGSTKSDDDDNDDDDDDNKSHNDADEGEEKNAATIFYEGLVDRANIGDAAGDAIAQFLEVLHLTPRGRFDIDMYSSSLRLRGKTYDYKIQYDAIKKFMLLPKPDDLHHLLCLGLDPPLQQGQTRYPFVVMQFKRDEEVSIELNMTAEQIEQASAKSSGRLKAHYEQPMHLVIADVFTGLTNKKVTMPAKSFQT